MIRALLFCIAVLCVQPMVAGAAIQTATVYAVSGGVSGTGMSGLVEYTYDDTSFDPTGDDGCLGTGCTGSEVPLSSITVTLWGNNKFFNTSFSTSDCSEVAITTAAAGGPIYIISCAKDGTSLTATNNTSAQLNSSYEKGLTGIFFSESKPASWDATAFPYTPKAVPALPFYGLLVLGGLTGLFGLRKIKRLKSKTKVSKNC